MNLLDQFGNFIYNKLKEKYQTPGYIPYSSGGERSTVPTWQGFMPSRKLQEVPLDFAREWFTTMEHLAVYNQDVGYALDNIVQLANTDHEIYFSDKLDEKLAAEMKEFLKQEQKKWYNFSGGIRSLKADLLTQIVINGALSAEIIPDKTLSGIKQIVRVAPKYITFVYNKDSQTFDPYQNMTSIGVETDFQGLKKLNTKTYKYIALRRIYEGPYPVPPFMGAVEGLIIQKDMTANLKFIMQKLGMLGFLSATVTPPEQDVGESEEVYHNRLIEYLEKKVYPQLEKNLGKGMVAGFKGSHEFQLQGNNMNVTGAEGLVKIVQLMIFAGLKQDPNMLGRNYSTTETFGRVILQKMLSQIRDYQQVVDSFFAEAYYMALRLKGYSPGYVEVVSESPLVGDRMKEEQAEKLKIDNIIKKRNEGIIDQTGAANEMGYDNPAEDGPVYGASVPVSSPTPNDPPIEDKKAPEEEPVVAEEIKRVEKRLKKHVPEYQYHTVDCDGSTLANLHSLEAPNFGDQTIQNFAERYFNQSFLVYKKAMARIGKRISETLSKMDSTTSLNTVSDTVYLELLKSWEQDYVNKQLAVTVNNVDKIYTHYRKDKTVFGEPGSFSKSKSKFADGFQIPEAIFGMDDFRAIEFAESFDSMFLGKFITDADTKKKVYKFIEDNYVSGDLPFGNNPGNIASFQDHFQSMLEMEGWKIRRVIDTTVNNIRNDANIMYIKQAKVEQYEVVELVDNLTCDYCKFMNGKRFSSETTVTKIQNKVNSSPENINEVSPFATSIKLDEFQNMSTEQLSSSNIQQPCYHPHCRGRVIAVI